METAKIMRAAAPPASAAGAAAPESSSPPIDTDQMRNLRHIGAFLTFLWILHIGAQNYQLPAKLFLKNHLGLTALAVAGTIFIAQFAWTIKFVFAWVCDSFPVRHRRRVPYLIFGSAVAAIGYAGLMLPTKSIGFFDVTLAIAQIGLVFCSCSLGGLMVETGNAAGTLAKLTSIRGTLWYGMALVTGPIAGFLAGGWIGLTSGFCIACCVGTVFLVLFIKEPVVAQTSRDPLHLLIDPIVGLFGTRKFWIAILACILLNIAPGFSTPLLFMQQNVLKFSPQTIGNFGVVSGSCAVISGLVCVSLSKRWPLKRLLVVATVMNAVLTLAYLQYNSLGHAIVIEGIGGFINAPSTVVIFLIAGYAIPRGFEAIGYSIMMAISNATTSFSDVFGSFLSTQLHWTFPQLVWINALTTLSILLLVPFIPKTMLARKDKA